MVLPSSILLRQHFKDLVIISYNLITLTRMRTKSNPPFYPALCLVSTEIAVWKRNNDRTLRGRPPGRPPTVGRVS